MEKTVRELAEFLHGKLENDAPELKVTGVNGLVEAGANDISFAVPPHVEHCHLSKAGVMVLGFDDPALPDNRPVIRVENPRAAFAALLELFRHRAEVERVVSDKAYIAPGAKIGKDVAVMPFAYIDEGAEIGDGTVIYPHVYVGRNVKVGAGCLFYPSSTIREGCVLGNKVVLQSGAVIGGDGFGYITDKKTGKHSFVLQAGNVVLEDEVEIGSNSCIDRATAGSTVVGAGTKIDNLVHLGHNISGSVTAGDNCVFAGQVGTVGHITIGNNCQFAGRTGITHNIPDNSVCAGFPAQPYKEWLKQEANLRKVGDLLKKVKELEKALAELKK